MEYPEFNLTHPPRVPSIDVSVPRRTQTRIFAEIDIGPDRFDFIIDPKYAWQRMRGVSPNEFKRRKDTKAAKLAEVERYHVTRGVYWSFIASVKPGQRTVVVRDLVKRETREKTTRMQTFEESLSESLGITLGATIPVDVVAVKAEVSSTFTATFKNTLEIGEELERAVTTEHEVTDTYQTREGVTYLLWRKCVELTLYRYAKGASKAELVSTMVIDLPDIFIDPLGGDDNKKEESR